MTPRAHLMIQCSLPSLEASICPIHVLAELGMVALV